MLWSLMLIQYWPTQYTVITNRFGTDPAYYKQYGLPGHEGLDVRVQTRAAVSPIYSCTEGQITFIGYRTPKDPYGYQVRVQIEYQGREYEFIYAHMVDQSCALIVGSPVHPGTIIGTGGATGNARGAHLHVSICRVGATRNKETTFPSDLINPEPLFKEYIQFAGLEVEWL
jgi:murein DD-endopeptidase MepM/ murein hydrolase activator NlpD